MKRSEFLRMSVLALLAAPFVNQTETVDESIAKIAAKYNFPIEKVEAKRFIQFKASTEIIKDKAAFQDIINQFNTKGKFVKSELGWVNDDFANDLFTVRLYFA